MSPPTDTCADRPRPTPTPAPAAGGGEAEAEDGSKAVCWCVRCCRGGSGCDRDLVSCCCSCSCCGIAATLAEMATVAGSCLLLLLLLPSANAGAVLASADGPTTPSSRMRLTNACIHSASGWWPILASAQMMCDISAGVSACRETRTAARKRSVQSAGGMTANAARDHNTSA